MNDYVASGNFDHYFLPGIPIGSSRWLQRQFFVSANDTIFPELPGTYLFTGFDGLWTDDGWRLLYVDQTESLRKTLYKHAIWAKAAEQGASHVHWLLESSPDKREELKQTLIRVYSPPLN